jgi:hypothetical protein
MMSNLKLNIRSNAVSKTNCSKLITDVKMIHDAKMTALIVSALLVNLLLLLMAASALAEWQGKFEVSEGVPHVLNPESPAEGESVLELNELWRVGGDDEDIFFGVIAQLLHDDKGNIYVLDSQLSEIMIFTEDGEYLQSIGREGEGPGEFRNGIDLFWAPGDRLGVVQVWPGKIVFLQPDGNPGGVFKLPYRNGVGFQSATRGVGLDNRIIMSGTAWSNEDGQQLQFSYLKAYDIDGNELAHFHEDSREVRFGGWEFKEETYTDFQRRWAAAPDGRVAAVLPFFDYQITVWNVDGSLDRIIARPDNPLVPRTAQEKKRFQAMYDRFTRWNPESSFQVADNHQSIGQIFFRDDGSLWVQSAQDMWRPEAGRYTSFDVYDHEGRYVQKVHLQADADAVEDGLFFVGDRAYIVTDLFSAMMASLGGDEGDMEVEPEPVTVIAYEFTPPGLAVTKAQ